MNKIFITAMAIMLSVVAFSQTEALWLRYPAISPDGQKIAFTYKGDIYTVSSSGGTAIPLTFHEAHDFMAVWSNDGKKIAFASDRYGNFDVFVVSAGGGEPQRLTYHSSDEYPYAFTPDDREVIFGANRPDGIGPREYPAGYQPQVYEVPANGGKVAGLWPFAAEAVQVNREGNLFIYQDLKGGENEWRKHHKSSVAKDIWLYDKGKDNYSRLTAFQGEDRNPVFSPDEKSVYYLSEESGSFNVYSLLLSDPSEKSRLTHFKNNPVRFLSISDKGLLCFGYDGSLFTMNPGDEPRKLDIVISTAGKTNSEKVADVSGNVSEMAVSPNGKEIAFIVRGEVFVTSVEGGVTKRITNTPEEERYLDFSPSGDTILYASQRGNNWAIYSATKERKEEPYFYASTLIREEPLITNTHDCYQPRISPDGKEIAYIEGRRSLKVYNLATRQTRELISPENMFYMSDYDQYYRWSPDSKWLLAKYTPEISNSEVALIRADGSGKFINLTRSGYNDEHPEWVDGGKAMIWFSDRDGLRSYATSGRRQSDVYAMFFTREAWDRFRLSKDDYDLLKAVEKINKEKEKSEKKKDSKKKEPETKKDTLTVKIDMGDNLYERKARLTISSSSLGDAVLSKDGEKLYYLARFEKGLNLWSTNVRTKETKMELALNAGRASMSWDKEMKNLYLLADGKILKVTPESWKKEPVAFNYEMTFNLPAERRYEFDYVWRKTKTTFYTSSFHGANWDSLYIVYSKFLPYIGDGFEFSELLSEMLGELNVSHSGSRYIRTGNNGDKTASLGILSDYSFTGNGIRIKEIVKDGPLDKASINVNPGMIIEQIDGDTVNSVRDYAYYLNRKEGKFTLLTILNPDDGKRQSITVKPISLREESGLLYKRWVRINQDEVDSLSGGKLGYVHIPGMSDEPYRSIYEDMMGKYSERKAVIVDTRFNGGGDLVSDLTTFLTGRKYLEYATEKRPVGYEPYFRWTKPTVAMFNEANYSDGDCFSCGYKQLGIGKTIGMPVPGTCSWANWEVLEDGTTRWGVIPVSTRDINGNWMENVETVPDYQVRNEPGIISRGRDQQLEKAVEVLLNEIK